MPPEKIAPRLPCGTHSLRRLRPRAIRLNRPACIPRLSDAQMGGHINAASRKSSAASGDRRLAQRYALACAASWAVASAYYVAALRSRRTLEWEYNRHSFCNHCRHAELRSPHLLTRLGRNRCTPPDISSERHASSRNFNTLQRRKQNSFGALQSVALLWLTQPTAPTTVVCETG